MAQEGPDFCKHEEGRMHVLRASEYRKGNENHEEHRDRCRAGSTSAKLLPEARSSGRKSS